jgi:hypothetical protein
MQIPDSVIFGPDETGRPINYGYVRSVKDENELIELLKLRLKTFFIDQVEPLLSSRCAFPLTTMACIGIETMGSVFISEKKDDASFQFVETIKKIDQFFGRKPNKKYHAKLQTIWPGKDLKNIDNFGKLIYRFFRNTMIHGYQAKGMFLSWETTHKIEIDETFAFITLNPKWFWEIFKDFFDRKFEEILIAEKNNTERQNCLNYIRDYLLA